VACSYTSGRTVRAAPWTPAAAGAGLAPDATLRAYALRFAQDSALRSAQDFALPSGQGSALRCGRERAPSAAGSLGLRREDLRVKVRSRPLDSLVVFLVDASASMGSLARLRAARGAILTLLEKARLRRLHTALVIFRDRAAQVLLQPTASITLAQRCLLHLPLGGTTPFADGLRRALELIRSERLKNPRLQASLVILSDGEANVPLIPGADCRRELLALAGLIRAENVASLVVDSRPGAERGRIPAELAAALGGRCRRIGRLRAGTQRTLCALLDTLDSARS
jgi:magnesium chelatase subunit ChlD-like protein